MKTRLFIALLILVCAARVYAQKEEVVKHDTIWSDVIKEKRALEVIFPKSDPEQNSGKPYEAVYVLDGISDFVRLEWAFLQGEGFVPKHLILVGVENTFKDGVNLRDRDFTPTKLYPNSGGAPQFLRFFKDELIPYIDKHYHGKPTGNTLYGGSLAGLFVVYTYLHAPGLFTSYMAVDPSLWWDNNLEDKLAEKELPHLPGKFHTLWIVGRKGNAYHFMGTAGIDTALQKKAPSGLSWKVTLYENDTHFSTNFKGFYEGLKFSYGGFYASTAGYSTSREIAIKPMRGIVARGIPFPLICYNVASQYYLHYTTDGKEPTAASPLLTGEETPIKLDSSCTVTVRSIGARPEYDRQASADFQVIQAPPVPLDLPPYVKKGGLHYTLYQGSWTQMPVLKKLKPLRSGFADSAFDIVKQSGPQSTVCVLQGYLKIDRTGYYIFEVGDGNENSRIEVAEFTILGPHFQRGRGENFMLPLEKGYYPYKITYFHKKGEVAPAPVYVKPEGIEDFPLPSSMLYGKIR